MEGFQGREQSKKRVEPKKNPQHQYCPAGVDSWCTYRKAKAEKKLKNFKHPLAFDKDTQALLKPIYEDPTADDLLERCLGANTQNNNESFNACVWNIVPKHMFVGKTILEIAAFSAACVFNEGTCTTLKNSGNDGRPDRLCSQATHAEH